MKIKQILSLSFALSLFCFSVSCNKRGSLDKNGLPSWVFDDQLTKGKITAVGVADNNSMYKIQYAIAKNDAYANLAQKISSYVNRVAEESLESSMNSNGSPSNADQKKMSEAKQSFSQKTTLLVKDLQLNGIQPVNMYKDPKSGVLYVKVEMDEDLVNNFLLKQKDIYKNDIYNKLGSGVSEKFDSKIKETLKK